MLTILNIVATLLTALLIIACVAALFVAELEERRRLTRLSVANCTGRYWRRAYPAATKQDIRDYLDLAIQSFGIPRRFRLRFDPAVSFMDLYRAVEPPLLSMGVDAMEFETFAEEFEHKYKLDLEQYWHDDMTLGEAFALTQNNPG